MYGMYDFQEEEKKIESPPRRNSMQGFLFSSESNAVDIGTDSSESGLSTH